MHLLNFVYFLTSRLFKAVIKKFQKKIPDLETLNLKYMSNLIYWSLLLNFECEIKKIIFHQHLSLKVTFKEYYI